jgi:tetratricopeptide (TPR) repeat protein
VITLQTEVANAIADRIQGRLGASDRARLAASHAVDPKAYEAYLKGRYFWAKYTAEGWKKGIEYFNQAIEIDPSYARAYAGLADCYLRLGAFGEMPVDDAMPKGEAAARKALEVDGTLGEAHFSLAFAKTFYDFDWSGAEREFQRAFQLDPGNAIGHMTYSVYLSALGRPNEAVEEEKRALELDPLSLIINTNLARAYHFAGEYDKALEQCRRTLALDPSFEEARSWVIVAYWEKGMYREAVQENQAALVRSGKAQLAAELGHVFAARGHRGVEEWELQTTLKDWRRGEAEASDVAMAYAGLGKIDEAFEWLEKARKAHDAPIALVKAMRSYDSLRSDPRYPEFLHRMKLPQ